MFEGMTIERPREPLSRDMGELKELAKEENFCLRCLYNSGLKIKIVGDSCPNCGLLSSADKHHKI